jgi:hypothetical protein
MATPIEKDPVLEGPAGNPAFNTVLSIGGGSRRRDSGFEPA